MSRFMSSHGSTADAVTADLGGRRHGNVFAATAERSLASSPAPALQTAVAREGAPGHGNEQAWMGMFPTSNGRGWALL